MKVDFIAGALPYAEQLSWKVLLLGPGEKVPFISKAQGGAGVHGASSDPDQIRAWGTLCPGGNIGIACGEASGIVVVDVDPRNGGDVSIRALAAKAHFPEAPRALTGNGGHHLLYRHQPGISNSKNRLGPGIDVKSDSGYIVAAPSWTKASDSGPGGPYVWQVSPFDVAVPRMPLWMVAMLCPPPRRPTQSFLPDVNGGGMEALARAVTASNEGARNNRLHWAACRAAEMVTRHQVSAQFAGSRLVAAAAAGGYSGAEVAKTIDSAFKRFGLRFMG